MARTGGTSTRWPGTATTDRSNRRRVAKSIGHEETFPTDIRDLASLEHVVVRLADSVASRLRAAGRAGRTVQLKVRYAGFRTITRSRTLREPTDLAADIAAVAGALLRDVPDLEVGIRLIGVSMQQLSVPEPARQPDLFGPDLFGPIRPRSQPRNRHRSRARPRRFRRVPNGRPWSVRSTLCGHVSARMRWDPAPRALSRHRPCARIGMRSG